MRKVLIIALLALGFVSVPTHAQSAVAVDTSFCSTDNNSYEVRAFCPALGEYQKAYNDLKQYVGGNNVYKDYLSIFSVSYSVISEPPTAPGNDSNAKWATAYGADQNLKNKVDTYYRSLWNIHPANPHSIKSVMIALRNKALLQSTESVLLPVAQTMTNTVVANLTSRLDQQAGGSANTSGTTSLTSLAGSADLISIAEESGALTQSVNGATTTYSTNAETFFQVVTGSRNLGCIVCPFNIQDSKSLTAGEKFEKYVLSPTNISANYTLQSSTSATTSTTGQASGSSTTVTSAAVPSGATTLTGITVKYQILNKFDLKNKTISDKWKNAITQLAPPAKLLADDTTNVMNELDKVSSYNTEQAKDPPCGDFVSANGDGPKIVEQFDNCWNAAFPPGTFVISGSLATAVLTYFKDAGSYRDAWNTAVANAAGNLLTVQYTYNKPPNQPDTHDATVIYARAFGTQGQLNFNGAISLYNGALPSGAKYGRVHYGQVSGEFDRNLGATTMGGLQSQMSLAGYWQYQPEPSILNIPAGTVVPGTTIPLPNGVQEFVGTAGSLWVAQVKYTLKNSSGVSVPLGVSWSNKTDLLQGNKVGAQVGISYNFQGLSSLFTSKSAAAN